MMLREKGHFKYDANAYSNYLNALINKGEAYLYARALEKKVKRSKDYGFTLELTMTRLDSELTAETLDSLILFKCETKPMHVPVAMRARGMGRFAPVYDCAVATIGFLQAMGITTMLADYPSTSILRKGAYVKTGLQLRPLEYSIVLLEDCPIMNTPILRI